MDEETHYLINWKGQTQGPHNEKKIRSLLEERKIHSLFKVEVDGEEINGYEEDVDEVMSPSKDFKRKL